jgi:hypothetical protein
MIKTIQLLGKYGINKDVQPQELPENTWSDGINVRFRNGALERMKGEQKVFDTPSVTPYWLQPYNTATTQYWVHAGLSAVYADDGTTRTNITPTTAPTGAVDDRWTGGVLNGVLVMNNGKDIPWYWDTTGGVNKLVALPGWDSTWRAKSIRPFKNVLVAIGITKGSTQYPHLVLWSDVAAPGAVPTSWNVADLTKLAGNLDLAEDPSLMVDQLVMGDVNVIYKQNSMYAMRATGGTEVFSFQRLPGRQGLLTVGAVADTPVGHVVLTNGDVVLHAGQGARSIVDGVMRRTLFRTIDATNRKRSFVTTNPAASEVWICYPELGKASCTKAVVWNWNDQTWSIRSLDNVTYGATGQLAQGATQAWSAQAYSWADATFAWDEDELSPAQERLLLCSTTPLITASDVTGTRNGLAYTSRVERLGLTFEDASRVKTLAGLRVRVDGASGAQIQFQVGGAMNPEGSFTWGSPVTYTVGSSAYNQINLFATGRFIGIRILSLDNQPWRLTSLDVDFSYRGRY